MTDLMRKPSSWRDFGRQHLTLDDIERMVEASLFGEQDRLELSDGKLVPTPPQGIRHENVCGELADFRIRNRPADVFVRVEPRLNLSHDRFTNPDILLHPRGLKTPVVRGPTSLLVIEISDSSLSWVIGAWSLETRVFTGPTPTGFSSDFVVKPDKALTPSLIPGLSLTLDQLPI
jgi:hypothetical protein